MHSRCFHARKRLALHHNARGRKGIDHFPLILGGILIDFAIALSWISENNDTVNQPCHGHVNETTAHAKASPLSYCFVPMPLPGFCAVSQLTAPSLIIIYHIRTRSLSSPGVGGPKLYRRRVKHDADGGTEGLGGQVRPELGADNARVAVRPGDLAPDDADLGALDGALGAVDVCAHINLHVLRSPGGSRVVGTYMLRAYRRTIVRRRCRQHPRA
jgi:hypothetical protein